MNNSNAFAIVCAPSIYLLRCAFCIIMNTNTLAHMQKEVEKTQRKKERKKIEWEHKTKFIYWNYFHTHIDIHEQAFRPRINNRLFIIVRLFVIVFTMRSETIETRLGAFAFFAMKHVVIFAPI